MFALTFIKKFWDKRLGACRRTRFGDALEPAVVFV
jgi:hypothetical protein